jgi:hypothetical protein
MTRFDQHIPRDRLVAGVPREGSHLGGGRHDEDLSHRECGVIEGKAGRGPWEEDRELDDRCRKAAGFACEHGVHPTVKGGRS